MAPIPSATASDAGLAQGAGAGAGSQTRSLVIVTILFFMWGLLTSLNDVLIPHLKAVYTLNYVQAAMVQFCFFGAYFIVSLPAGRLIKAIGYQRGAVTGLVIAAIGCALFYPAANTGYGLFLCALFVLAAGITILQVAANPYVTLLGPAKTASSRLTMTQAFNSLGTVIGPYFGSVLILSGGAVAAAAVTGGTLDPAAHRVIGVRLRDRGAKRAEHEQRVGPRCRGHLGIRLRRPECSQGSVRHCRGIHCTVPPLAAPIRMRAGLFSSSSM